MNEVNDIEDEMDMWNPGIFKVLHGETWRKL